MKLSKPILICIILSCIIIIFLIGVFHKTIVEGFEEDSIPKKIWTFWDSEVLPEIIQKCINTWKTHNPEYEITVVNKSNLSTYLPDVDFSKIKHIESSTRFSDMVRLHILDRYGGIWSDASVICIKPYDSWISENKSEFIGFYMDSFTLPEFKESSPIIESWFFACKKGSVLVHDWLTEFLRISEYDTIDKYVEAVKSENVNIQNISNPSYLSIHVACQKVLQKGKHKPYHFKVLKAEDTAFKYLTTNEWNSEKAIQNILDCKHDDNATKKTCELLNTPIIKLRGTERETIEKNHSASVLFQ